MKFMPALLSVVLLLTLGAGPGDTPSTALADHYIYLPLIVRQPSPSNNLNVHAATYLGGTGGDALNAVDVTPTKEVVLGGTMPGHNPGGVSPTPLLGGGDGVVVRLNKTGRSVLSVTRIGDIVNDLEINASGDLLVCGDFGVALLDATASSVSWSATPGTGERCALGDDGTAAVLVDDTLHTYGSGGSPHQSWTVTGDEHSDVAIAGAKGLVVATGYAQKTTDLQVAFLRAWDYEGNAAWTSYDFSASAISGQGLGADTQGRRVALGRDGLLYFAGTSSGGTGSSIFSRDPKNVTQKLGSDRYITTDRYNNPYNVSNKTVTWYGRYDPADGTLEMGQPLLVRLSSGKGNSISPRSIMANESGYIFVAGETYASIENRDQRKVAGTPVGPYSEGEAFLLIVGPNLQQRFIWTPFSGPGESAKKSPATGVSVRNGTAAIAITLNNGSLITHEALQPEHSTLSEGYTAVWSW